MRRARGRATDPPLEPVFYSLIIVRFSRPGRGGATGRAGPLVSTACPMYIFIYIGWLHTVVTQNRNKRVARRTVEFAVHLPSASVHARLSDLEKCTTAAGGCALFKTAFKKLNAVKSDVYHKRGESSARRQR